MNVDEDLDSCYLRPSPPLVPVFLLDLIGLMTSVIFQLIYPSFPIGKMFEMPPTRSSLGFNVFVHLGVVGYCTLLSLILVRMESSSKRSRMSFRVACFFGYLSVVSTHFFMILYPWIERPFLFVCLAVYIGLSLYEIRRMKWHKA